MEQGGATQIRSARCAPISAIKPNQSMSRSPIWLSNQSANILIRSLQRPISMMTARHGRSPCCCCSKPDNVPKEEMCHEEIHHCSRVDLADRDPVAHRDCKRSSRVPVEPRVREQRLLTISGASERFCSRLKTWAFAGRLACTRESATLSQRDQSRR